jgi:hypothetical protein
MSKGAASIVAAIGASGSGKSLWIKRELARGRPRRLLIWDPQSEYADHGTVFDNRAALAEACIAAGTKGPLAAVYRPGNRLSDYAGRFDWLCRLAYAWRNCTLVVEELGDVTKPGWAPDGWSLVTRKGRHAGLKLIGAAQRPAVIDKTFFGLATLIHCGRLNYKGDVTVMADVLQIPGDDITGMKALEWIERNMQTGQTRRGTLEI